MNQANTNQANTNQTNTTQTPKPRSEAQIAASRANGAKSHGPVTPEGKAISARNSRRHGILAQTTAIDSEDPGQLQLLFRELYETWDPADEHERNLVDTMVLSIWRRTRILGMEAAGISLKMREQAASRIIKPGTVPPNGHTTGYLAVTSLAEENRAFELLHRYETRYTRAYERAARSLIAYRKYRQAESDQTPEPTPDPTPEPAPTKTQNLPHEPKPLTPPRNAREFQKWQRKMAQRGLTLPPTSRPEPK